MIAPEEVRFLLPPLPDTHHRTKEQKMWKVQTSKGKGSYLTRYTFETKDQAILYYDSIVVHSGHKKRLLDPMGKVVARTIT
jgi:hypothetical protein